MQAEWIELRFSALNKGCGDGSLHFAYDRWPILQFKNQLIQYLFVI